MSKLTFDGVKEFCTPGKVLFENEEGEQRLYVGFNRVGELITDKADGFGCLAWLEAEIENWEIISLRGNNS